MYMNITDPNPDDITLQQAASMAGCNAKTIRRAVQDGHLPRRYVMSERGPQLVFLHGDMERWIAGRVSKRRSGRHGELSQQVATQAQWAALAQRLEQLQTMYGESQATIDQLQVMLRDQEQALGEAQTTIASLVTRLAAVEAHEPAPPDPGAAATTASTRMATTLARRRGGSRSG